MKSNNNELKPTVICLCGSTRFKELFELANKRLTLSGYIVLTVGFFLHAESEKITNEQKIKLDKLHKEKIKLSDMVLILSEYGYVGDSTASEIAFAKEINKPLKYYNHSTKYPLEEYFIDDYDLLHSNDDDYLPSWVG